MIFFYAAAVMLVIAFVIDIRVRKIPNWLTGAGTVAGVTMHAAMNGWNGASHALLGLAAGFGPLFTLYWLKAVGAGDVKLFAALGALTGAGFVLYAFAASLLVAGLEALLILLWRGELMGKVRRFALTLLQFAAFKDTALLAFWRGNPESARYVHFPFMWAVLPGSAYAWWQWFGM